MGTVSEATADSVGWRLGGSGQLCGDVTFEPPTLWREGSCAKVWNKSVSGRVKGKHENREGGGSLASLGGEVRQRHHEKGGK